MAFPTEITRMSDKSDYTEEFVAKCELLWGKGFLAPHRGCGIFDVVPATEFTKKHVLDFGCGLGGPSLTIAEHADNVVGLDISGLLLSKAAAYAVERRISNIRFDRVDIACENLPLQDGIIDVIYSRDAVVHIAEKRKLFDEFFRIAAPGAKLLLSDWYGTCAGKNEAIKKFLTATGLELSINSIGSTINLLQAVGFAVEQVHSRAKWYRSQATKDVRDIDGRFAGDLDKLLGREKRERWSETRRRLVAAIDVGEFTPYCIVAHKP